MTHLLYVQIEGGALMEPGQTWYGKDGTEYAGVVAIIDVITARNVQLTYDRIVEVGGVRLAGQVMGKGKFKRMFEEYHQSGLFE